jgi:hypothetical protein
LKIKKSKFLTNPARMAQVEVWVHFNLKCRMLMVGWLQIFVIHSIIWRKIWTQG